MILVRDVFQLKFGKAKEVKALWSDVVRLVRKHGHGPSRAMFDVTGPYYTFVMESTHENLAAFEKAGKEMMGDAEFGGWYQKFVPLIESGHREIFDLLP